MNLLPVNETYCTRFKFFIKKLQACFAFLKSDKSAVTFYNVKQKKLNTIYFRIEKQEAANHAKLTLMNLSKDQDLSSKLVENLPENVLL